MLSFLIKLESNSMPYGISVVTYQYFILIN